jgi:hypothetical protein
MSDSLSKTIDTALKSLALDDELSIRINGICMLPLIKDGAMVSIRKQSFYWPGDILVKREHNGRLSAHRLIGFYPRKGQLYFVSRADNTKSADAAVPGAQIIGRVSGGECAKSAVSVPVRYRIKAVGQFAVLVVKRLSHRISTV